MSEQLELKITILENEVTLLKEKINEIIACLDENELSRKTSVDYLETEEEEKTG